jgi:tripartite ATP-independent transporter DctP family solute receptor
MKLFKITCVMLLVASFSFPLFAAGEKATDSGAQEKIVLRWSDTNAENDEIVVASKRFAESVKEKTDGRIQIEVFPSGQLGDNMEVLKALQMGAIDITRVKPGHLSDLGLKGTQVYSLPYIFEDLEHARRVLRSDLGMQILDGIQKEGEKLVGLGYYANAPRSFFFRDKKVSTLDDMKGLKIRVMPGQIYVDLAESFGASATPMAFSELYSALQTGVVDGAEQPVKGFYAQKFYEVCKYFTFDNHQADPSIVVISEMTWNSLSKEDQALLKETLSEASLWFDDTMDVIIDEYIEELKNEGVVFSEVEDMHLWQAAAQELYKVYGEGFEEEIAEINNLR